MKTLLSQPLPKIQTACGNDPLRPCMEHVFFHKNTLLGELDREQANMYDSAYFVATNAHVLAYFSAEQVFSLEFIMELPESFYLSQSDYKKLTSKKVVTVEYIKEQSQFLLILKGGGLEVVTLKNQDSGNILGYNSIGNFPKYWNILPTKNTEIVPANLIGYNSDYLELIASIYEGNAVSFKIYGPNKATEIRTAKPENLQIRSILMPVMLDNYNN